MNLKGLSFRKIAVLLLVFCLVVFTIGAVEYNRVLYSDDISVPGMRVDESGYMGGEIDANAKLKTGEAIITVLRDILKEMRKDWLPNDMMWPTQSLDNPQSYQEGQLFAVRQILQVISQKTIRTNPSDPPNQRLVRANAAVSIDSRSWMMPAFEDELGIAIDELDKLLPEIQSGQIRIADRRDTLRELLDVLSSIVGGSVGRLESASRVGKYRMTTVTAGDSHAKGERLLDRESAQTPWLEIDNEFYYSQGVMFVVRFTFAAVLVDFRNLIETQNSTELGRATLLGLDPYFYGTSPWMVTNGDPLSLLANHSTALNATLLNTWFGIKRLSDAVSGQ